MRCPGFQSHVWCPLLPQTLHPSPDSFCLNHMQWSRMWLVPVQKVQRVGAAVAFGAPVVFCDLGASADDDWLTTASM